MGGGRGSKVHIKLPQITQPINFKMWLLSKNPFHIGTTVCILHNSCVQPVKSQGTQTARQDCWQGSMLWLLYNQPIYIHSHQGKSRILCNTCPNPKATVGCKLLASLPSQQKGRERLLWQVSESNNSSIALSRLLVLACLLLPPKQQPCLEVERVEIWTMNHRGH